MNPNSVYYARPSLSIMPGQTWCDNGHKGLMPVITAPRGALNDHAEDDERNAKASLSNADSIDLHRLPLRPIPLTRWTANSSLIHYRSAGAGLGSLLLEQAWQRRHSHGGRHAARPAPPRRARWRPSGPMPPRRARRRPSAQLRPGIALDRALCDGVSRPSCARRRRRDFEEHDLLGSTVVGSHKAQLLDP